MIQNFRGSVNDVRRRSCQFGVWKRQGAGISTDVGVFGVGMFAELACFVAVPPGGTINAAANQLWDYWGHPVPVGTWRNVSTWTSGSTATSFFQRIN